MSPIPIAILGTGKIARSQHVPAIAASPDFRLEATADPAGGIDGIESHGSLEALLLARPDIEAIALCLPPGPRFAAARAALAAGRHVLLEKPPGATLSEVAALARHAAGSDRTVFAAWHSRHAPGVAAARRWLAGRQPRRIRIDWLEDVRKWHPGQDWIWQPGGFGVFDTGINALSILSALFPQQFRVTAATLAVPSNRAMPIAAELALGSPDGLRADARFDWRHDGPELWQIEIDCGGGTLRLDGGGADASIGGQPLSTDGVDEYPALYRRFAGLIRSGASELDAEPLRHVADAFHIGRRIAAAPFHD